MPPTPDPKPEAPAAHTPTKRRWTTHTFRWRVRLLLAIPVIVALGALVLMRSPLVGKVVAGRIEALTGCTLEGTGATGAFIDPSGNLHIEHFGLRLPGVPGDAGLMLSADAAVVDLDWSGVLAGNVVPTTLRLNRPVFRVSTSVEDGELNIGALRARPGAGSAATLPRSAPRVDVIDATIVVGEHARATGEMKVLRKIRVSGSFMPAEKDRPVYVVRASEVGTPGKGGMLLDGSVELDTGKTRLELVNIPLDAWGPESIPVTYRELWRRMNVQGRIASVSLHSDKEGSAHAEVTLDRVSMNALIPAENAGTPESMHDLALREVSGRIRMSRAGIRADLTGRIEGQEGESEVVLNTIGTDIDAPMTCEITAKRISLTKDTPVLPYMPARAREYFRLFSGPTGEVDARVVISRGAPRDGAAAPINVSGGRLTLRHGAAAFHRFPYPFGEMTGSFEFDESSIKIVDLRGTGPTGATLHATGVISPLTDEAMVDVSVHAERVPVDRHLLDAMPADRRRVVEGMFSRPEYDRLIADGLIRRPGGVGSAPEFSLAGLCTIDVHVHSPEGRDAPWFTTIDVRFPEAGMLPDPFPVPVHARNVHLHITDDDARLVSGEFAPISGGSLGLEAAVTFFSDGVKQVRPDVRVAAADVPVDAFLLHALPSDEDGAEMSVGELMRRLHPRGTVSCQARITADPDAPGTPGEPPRIAYDIGVDLGGVACEPAAPGETAAFSIEDLRGTLRVSRAALMAESLTGRLYPTAASVDPALGPAMGPSSCAEVSLGLEKRLEGDTTAERGRLDMTLAITSADLAQPLERLAGTFSPEAGATLASLRADHHPLGRLNTTVHLKRAPGPEAPTAVGVTLDHASNVEFDALGGRVGVEWPEGVVELTLPASGEEQLRFDRVRARLRLDGVACGEADVDGFVALDPATGLVAPPGALTGEFTGWRFESPLLPALLVRLSGPGAAGAYRELNAAGPFDAKVVLASDRGAERGPASALMVRAELRPKRMAFDWEGSRIAATEVTGGVSLRTFSGSGSHPVWGTFDHLGARTANWDVAANGNWYIPPRAQADGRAERGEPRVRLDIALGVEGRAMDAGLRALMPQAAVDAMGALDAEFRGPFALRTGVVKTTLGDAPAPSSFTGTLEFTDLAFDIGVKVDRCTGRADIRVDDAGPAEGGGAGGAATTFEITPIADTLRIAGIRATSATATIRSGGAPGEIVVPEFNVQCYGGKVTGHAGVRVEQSAPGTKGRKVGYDAEMVMAGVRLAPVLVDAAASGATDPGPMGPPNPEDEPDASRGRVDARLTIEGIAGDLASRRGGGAIRISNGDIIKMPVMLPLIQVSNFQIPRRDRLGYLQSDFTIVGETAVFERVSLLSNSVAIEGEGTLTWPDLTLDMKFNSRSMARVPLFTDIFELLRNEIVSTRVRGTLSDPVVREEPFTGTRRALDRLLNPGDYAKIGGLEPDGPVIPAAVERKRTEAGTEAPPNAP